MAKKSKNESLNSESDDEQARHVHKRAKMYDSSSYDSSEAELNENDNFCDNEFKAKTNRLLDSKSWTCAHSSKEQAPINHNAYIIKKLEEMTAIYESTRDKFRALSYQKAIMALKRHAQPLQSIEVTLKLCI